MHGDDFKGTRLFGHYTFSLHATHELHIDSDVSSITGWEIDQHGTILLSLFYAASVTQESPYSSSYPCDKHLDNHIYPRITKQ